MCLHEQGARGQGLQACLGEFQKFLDQNMSALSHNPNCLFRLASLRSFQTRAAAPLLRGILNFLHSRSEGQ